MRKALDRLYEAALIGACLSMLAIAVLVFLQVGGRILDRLASAIGVARPGFSVPSLAEIGGFLFVTAAFLALPATLRAAGHVRVTLLTRSFGPRFDRVASGFVLLVGLVLAGFAAWSVGVQALSSFERGSVSYGLVPIPLWLPQAVMTMGLAIFTVSLLDELAATATGGEAAFRRAERERSEGEGAH